MLYSHQVGQSEKEAKKSVLSSVRSLKYGVKLQIWRNVFYIPNCIHWSFLKPPFPKGVVALLGLAESVVGIMQTFPRE